MSNLLKLKKVSCLFSVLFCVSSVIVPIGTWAATLYLMPQSQTIYQGNTFIVDVKLDTEGEEINTVKVDLTFPTDSLGAIDFSQGNSILTLWPEGPKIQGKDISFVGGIPRGFNGDGLLGKITFLGKEIGRARVDFKETSKVLLNDGKGTPAELNFLEGNYEIVLQPEALPVLNSPSNPDQNKWYSANSFEIHWKALKEIDSLTGQTKLGAEYSYILSRDPLMEPDEEPEELIEDLKWEKMEDGIYYFFLREKRETDAKPDAEPREMWGPKMTYRFMIDATPPEPFEPQIAQIESKNYLAFATIDKTSGIDHYEVLETRKKEEEWKIGESPYLLEDQSLQSIIKVKAVDKAGNERMAEIVPPSPQATWQDILALLLILIGIGIVWWIIRKSNIKYKI